MLKRRFEFAALSALACMWWTTQAHALVTAWPLAENGNSLVSLPSAEFGGVAEIIVGDSGAMCSGALLADGRHVLSAAHCFSSTSSSATVRFPTADRNGNPAFKQIDAHQITLNPTWTGKVGSGGDLAILTLDKKAPLRGYDLYRQEVTPGQVVTLAGYGRTGNGALGYVQAGGVLRVGTNTFDEQDPTIAGRPYLYDFDDGTATHDTLGATPFAGLSPDIAALHLGTGKSEALVAPGDSGGGSFLNGLLVGIHSFTATPGAPFDINGDHSDSSFGELGAETRVAAYASWIDSMLVPEPATWSLLALGMSVFVVLIRPRTAGNIS